MEAKRMELVLIKLPLRAVLCALLLQAAALHGQCTTMAPMEPVPASVTYAPANSSLPTIFVVGDSTAVGWGPYLVPFFDPAKVNVVVAAAAGRSSRTYITQGLWERVQAQMRPRDIVLIQFGHNDVFAINDPCRARGSIRSNGEETEAIDNEVTHQPEVVHSFGWYLRQYVRDTKAKGAVPVVMSLTPDNVWHGDRMDRDQVGYAAWSAEVAAQAHVDYVDINAIFSDRFTKLGQPKTLELFAPHDRTHMTKVGWQLDALWTFEALEYLPDRPVDRFLSALGREALPVPRR